MEVDHANVSEKQDGGGSRKRRQWTADEDACLSQAIAERGARGWAEVAVRVGTRTDKQCRERWHNHLAPGAERRLEEVRDMNGGKKKRQWSQEEDGRLHEAVSRYGARGWAEVAKVVRTRTDKQCRERWHNHLAPDVQKKPWANGEDAVIMQHSRDGNSDYGQIARLLQGRTVSAVRNRAHQLGGRCSDSGAHQSGLMSSREMYESLGMSGSPRTLSQLDASNGQSHAQASSFPRNGSSDRDISLADSLDDISNQGLAFHQGDFAFPGSNGPFSMGMNPPSLSRAGGSSQQPMHSFSQGQASRGQFGVANSGGGGCRPAVDLFGNKLPQQQANAGLEDAYLMRLDDLLQLGTPGDMPQRHGVSAYLRESIALRACDMVSQLMQTGHPHQSLSGSNDRIVDSFVDDCIEILFQSNPAPMMPRGFQ